MFSHQTQQTKSLAVLNVELLDFCQLARTSAVSCGELGGDSHLLVRIELVLVAGTIESLRGTTLCLRRSSDEATSDLAPSLGNAPDLVEVVTPPVLWRIESNPIHLEATLVDEAALRPGLTVPRSD